ncbi:MAG: hypothetical protein AB2651_19180 [Candidatus Thiodiazotropha sp.]
MLKICVCGSSKFKELIYDVCDGLQNNGFIVLQPPLHNINSLSSDCNEEGKLLMWKGATFAHMYRINVSDICLFVNPNGYMGISSTLELGYAIAKEKLIYALRDDSELARQSTFFKVINSEYPEEIVDYFLNLRGEK